MNVYACVMTHFILINSAEMQFTTFLITNFDYDLDLVVRSQDLKSFLQTPDVVLIVKAFDTNHAFRKNFNL